MALTVHNKLIQYLLCTNTGFVQHECRCMQATVQDELHREDISSIVVNDLCAVRTSTFPQRQNTNKQMF